MVRTNYNEDNPFLYNHFESLKMIGTKAGLIRSLRQYYYTKPEAI